MNETPIGPPDPSPEALEQLGVDPGADYVTQEQLAEQGQPVDVAEGDEVTPPEPMEEQS